MVNALTTLRTDVKEVLEDAGLKAAEYVNEAVVPPVCVVVPASPYITTPEGENPFGYPYTVVLNVLVIGGKGTNKTAATNIDSMIVNVVDTLDEDWDVTEVTAPMEMTLNNGTYLGAVVTLEITTSITKEVM